MSENHVKAELIFRYGTMDAGKTLNLMGVAHNYQKKKHTNYYFHANDR